MDQLFQKRKYVLHSRRNHDDVELIEQFNIEQLDDQELISRYKGRVELIFILKSFFILKSLSRLIQSKMKND